MNDSQFIGINVFLLLKTHINLKHVNLSTKHLVPIWILVSYALVRLRLNNDNKCTASHIFLFSIIVPHCGTHLFQQHHKLSTGQCHSSKVPWPLHWGYDDTTTAISRESIVKLSIFLSWCSITTVKWITFSWSATIKGFAI
jgi:hypothetical protein